MDTLTALEEMEKWALYTHGSVGTGYDPSVPHAPYSCRVYSEALGFDVSKTGKTRDEVILAAFEEWHNFYYPDSQAPAPETQPKATSDYASAERLVKAFARSRNTPLILHYYTDQNVFGYISDPFNETSLTPVNARTFEDLFEDLADKIKRKEPRFYTRFLEHGE